jgi:hypothetical protein
MVLGFLHHVDHLTRSNHIGWPVVETVTPFTFSLLVYPLLLGGIYATARGRLAATYWIGREPGLLALVVFVHFVPLPHYESLADIYIPYADPLLYSRTTAHRSARTSSARSTRPMPARSGACSRSPFCSRSS